MDPRRKSQLMPDLETALIYNRIEREKKEKVIGDSDSSDSQPDQNDFIHSGEEKIITSDEPSPASKPAPRVVSTDTVTTKPDSNRAESYQWDSYKMQKIDEEPLTPQTD